jgi:hypothetical protein
MKISGFLLNHSGNALPNGSAFAFPNRFADHFGLSGGFRRVLGECRHDLKARKFRRGCDGHANTLTVILNTKGNIFGGFTPMRWDSSNCLKADDSQKSFLFTLKNPHNIPARRFVLKAEHKHAAVSCYSIRDTQFCGIWVLRSLEHKHQK